MKAIRALNLGLPEARRVHFTGFDEVQDDAVAAKWLEGVTSLAPDAVVKANLLA